MSHGHESQHVRAQTQSGTSPVVRPARKPEPLFYRLILAAAESPPDQILFVRRQPRPRRRRPYRYLMSEHKQLFRQLALHPGTDFSVYAAAAAAGNVSLAATEQVLDALLDHYLLEERGPGRFAFHDLIREYPAYPY